MQKFFIATVILLLSVISVGFVIEGFFQGCSGLDERECVSYPQCMWHIDRSRTDTTGRCISRKHLPKSIKKDLWWDRIFTRYFGGSSRYNLPHYYGDLYNPYYGGYSRYYGKYRPRYYYTDQEHSPWDRYNVTQHTLV